ncbi:hypothetical protein PF004_g31596 [Phytophthora fragariae]|uniref:Integrase zinc-binding domain-containing protein n=1 Tax=Phytophthora fragariae TaxID=53985 RepID=A0A6G0M9B3_9STRA|nr:hypothetical protein PF004_g31596 [Phytophthora fragariae]
MTSKEWTGRLHRWALQLQEYDFEIIYRAGTSNVVADALSRAPVGAVVGAAERPAGEQGAASSVGQLAEEVIGKEQAKDRMVKNLRQKGKYRDRVIVVEDEVVYIVQSDGSKKVVLPAALWAVALREGHDSIYSCHLRTPQTYERVARSYWWPDMRAYSRSG